MTQQNVTKSKNSIHFLGGNHLHITFLIIKLMNSRKKTASKRQGQKASSFSWKIKKNFLQTVIMDFFSLPITLKKGPNFSQIKGSYLKKNVSLVTNIKIKNKSRQDSRNRIASFQIKCAKIVDNS